MDNAKRGNPPALATGSLLGLLVCLLFVFGVAAQDMGGGSPPDSPVIDRQGAVEGATAAGIIITPTRFTISEPTGSDTFTATLASQPTSLVILSLAASDPTECSIFVSQVVWYKNDWQHAHVITVMAVDDQEFDGDQICMIETGPSTSIDPNYHDLDPEDVRVVVEDDEYLGFVYLPAVLRQEPETPTETEPNDTPPQANGPIASGVTYEGTLTRTLDIKDYFYIELAEAHTVEGWLTNIAEGEDYTLVVRYDDPPDYPVVPGGYAPQPGNAPEHVLTDVLAPGRYYIQIFNFEAGPGSTQPYHLRVVYE